MAFESKPGQFSLFKNQRKDKETAPDYKGDGLAPDGTPVWVSAWLKEGKNGKFMSCSMQPKESQQRAAKEPAKASGGMDDDIPFAPIGRGIGGHVV